PVFVDQEGIIQPELGRRLFMGPRIPQAEPNRETLTIIRERVAKLRQVAENSIRSQYQDYYRRVEAKRNEEIAILIEDLERFDRGTLEHWQERLKQIGGGQLTFLEDPTIKGQRTRLENQLKMHQHRMQERRSEIEKMRLGAFPAPELLNMIIVMPA
ncbi:MAG: hypothetical protein L0Y56_14180, partial [Nitrospira sp.]|nr:hypothetical protein [Nitrospira sp.]